MKTAIRVVSATNDSCEIVFPGYRCGACGPIGPPRLGFAGFAPLRIHFSNISPELSDMLILACMENRRIFANVNILDPSDTWVFEDWETDETVQLRSAE